MSAVVIDSGLIHYEAFGRGQPVLFLHGWLGSWRYWMSTMEAISDKYRTYALDLWGFGDSDKSRPRYEISDYVTLINNFTDNMGIREAPIVGHSLGATIALEYTVRFPDRAKKVMAVSLPVTADSIIKSRITGFTKDSNRLLKVFGRGKITHKEVEQEMLKTESEAIAKSLESVAELDVMSRIQMVAQSADAVLLAVYGEKDDIIIPDPERLNLNGSAKNIRPIGLAEEWRRRTR
jgi:pimeloyl-ACP methyl ester carboxylesterase